MANLFPDLFGSKRSGLAVLRKISIPTGSILLKNLYSQILQCIANETKTTKPIERRIKKSRIMKAINRNKNSPTSQIRIYTGNILKWMICNKRFFKLLFFISLTLICLKCGTAPFLIIIFYTLRAIFKIVFSMIITMLVIITTFLLFYLNFIN